ncbi:ATP phosphoribosyltransferase [Flaviaesturariibacter aridisoli]|uniref:ATP phosphoribosyltransferase n=1 Tax=Flaviaesturariibacter aridisoli TaxID=2545761 RepID=A0A4R4DYK2_9BACT|nr:ATP phosphoribosyltransferase [Flaviaesturariibacter aridisoli]TCZ69076.1 ATP phosphoribosyltransferase [Flaviaesturariibacter aridisoli]
MNLRIAIQKSGRLSEDSLKLLNDCGISVKSAGAKLRSQAENFPVEVYFLRDDDIPQYVQDGVADLGVVGENVLYEKCKDVEVVQKLGFGRCRLSLAVPRNSAYQSVASLEGRKIATSYPFLVESWLRQNRVDAEIHEISGSVEIAPGIGLADAVCDLVSSGSTLFMNGLQEVETILESEAVLVKKTELDEEKEKLLRKLLFRINSVQAARKNKYILLNAPNDALDEIFALLPGMKSPTVLPLAEEGWSSVHSVVPEAEFWDKIEALKYAGAQGILVVPIEKMIQ